MAYYDNNVVEEFNSYPTVHILRHLGISVPLHEGRLEGVISSPLRTDNSPSFSIFFYREKNIWVSHDFATDDKYNNVSLVKKILNCSTREAMDKIAAMLGRIPAVERANTINSVKTQRESTCDWNIIEQKPLSLNYLINYAVQKRHINRDVLEKYCQQVTYSTNGSNRFNAIGFPNISGGLVLRQADTVDSNGVARKRQVRCAKKSDVTIISSEGEFATERNFRSSDVVCIFEGLFDYLAWQTMRMECYSTVEPQCDIIVLNSVYNLERAMDCIFMHSVVYGFFDMDKTGREYSEKLHKRLLLDTEDTGTKYTFEDCTPNYCSTERGEKDISDYLSGYKKRSMLKEMKKQESTNQFKRTN